MYTTVQIYVKRAEAISQRRRIHIIYNPISAISVYVIYVYTHRKQLGTAIWNAGKNKPLHTLRGVLLFYAIKMQTTTAALRKLIYSEYFQPLCIYILRSRKIHPSRELKTRKMGGGGAELFSETGPRRKNPGRESSLPSCAHLFRLYIRIYILFLSLLLALFIGAETTKNIKDSKQSVEPWKIHSLSLALLSFVQSQVRWLRLNFFFSLCLLRSKSIYIYSS